MDLPATNPPLTPPRRGTGQPPLLPSQEGPGGGSGAQRAQKVRSGLSPRERVRVRGNDDSTANAFRLAKGLLAKPQNAEQKTVWSGAHGLTIRPENDCVEPLCAAASLR